MTVKDLRKFLYNFDDETEVYVTPKDESLSDRSEVADVLKVEGVIQEAGAYILF